MEPWEYPDTDPSQCCLEETFPEINPLAFFLLLKELRLNWMQSFSAAARCEQLKTEQVLYLEAGILQGLEDLLFGYSAKELRASPSPLPLCLCLGQALAVFYHPTAQCSLSTWMAAGNFTAHKNVKPPSQGMLRMGERSCWHWGSGKLSQNSFNMLNYPGVSMNYLISSRNSSQSPATMEFPLLAAEITTLLEKNSGYHVSTTELAFHSLKCRCWSQLTTKLQSQQHP